MQLLGTTFAKGLTKAALIQRCLAREGPNKGAHTEYKFLRILRGAALPDAAQLEALARALQTDVQGVLGPMDLAQIEALREVDREPGTNR